MTEQILDCDDPNLIPQSLSDRLQKIAWRTRNKAEELNKEGVLGGGFCANQYVSAGTQLIWAVGVRVIPKRCHNPREVDEFCREVVGNYEKFSDVPGPCFNVTGDDSLLAEDREIMGWLKEAYQICRDL